MNTGKQMEKKQLMIILVKIKKKMEILFIACGIQVKKVFRGNRGFQTFYEKKSGEFFFVDMSIHKPSLGECEVPHKIRARSVYISVYLDRQGVSIYIKTLKIFFNFRYLIKKFKGRLFVSDI